MARGINQTALLVLLLTASLSGCAQRGGGPGEVIGNAGTETGERSCCRKMKGDASQSAESCCAADARLAVRADQLVGKTFRQQTDRLVTTVRFESQGVLDITTAGLSKQPAHAKGRWTVDKDVVLLTLNDGQAKVEEHVKVMDDRLVGLPVEGKLPGVFASIKEAPESYTLVR